MKLAVDLASGNVLLVPNIAGAAGIPLNDGTLAVPQGANFMTEPGLGIWHPGVNLMGFAVNNGVPFEAFELGTGTELNSDPISPSVVRYAARGFMPALVGGTNETAHLFIRVDPTVGDPQQAGLYVDITSAQLDTWGPAIKVIHAGSGDAIYVAQVDGNGSAYEAASWTDGSRGYISTWQVNGLANSTLFNALAGFPTVPNYGLFYADLSFGNAFTIRRMDTANPGQSQIRLIEEVGGRERFVVYQDGSVKLQGDVATGGGGDQASPEMRLFGSIWDGAAAQVNGFIAKMIPAGGDNNGIYGLYHQSPLGTALILQVVNDNAVANSQIMVLGPNALGQYRGASLWSPATLQLLVGGGTLAAELVVPAVADDTAIGTLTIHQGGVLVTKKVTQGALNSGGAGFRALVVPN